VPWKCQNACNHNTKGDAKDRTAVPETHKSWCPWCTRMVRICDSMQLQLFSARPYTGFHYWSLWFSSLSSLSSLVSFVYDTSKTKARISFNLEWVMIKYHLWFWRLTITVKLNKAWWGKDDRWGETRWIKNQSKRHWPLVVQMASSFLWHLPPSLPTDWELDVVRCLCLDWCPVPLIYVLSLSIFFCLLFAVS
jgi:hypothetical protein